MKTKIFLIYLSIILFLTANVFAQGFTIGNGTTVSLGSSTFTLNGNWNNSGTLNSGNGTVVFSSLSGNQTIAKTGGETFNNLTINKAAGDVQLSSNITVNGTLTLTSGDIDMNGNTVTLGSSASLSETAGNTVKGSGNLTTTRDLTTSFNLMGIEITSTGNLGNTTITRGHTQQSSSGNNSILRYFNITPTNNSGLDASLVFHYDDSELNSLTENELLPFHSNDDGSIWTTVSGSTLNTSVNTVSFSGLSSLARFTLAASSAPLPVELVNFSADVSCSLVKLTWTTATEINNFGFEVERLPQPLPKEGANTPLSLGKGQGDGLWVTVGFVEGNGNSNSPNEYSFIDENPPIGNLQYRLKQIDTDGAFEYYSQIAEVNFNLTTDVNEKQLPNEFVLEQNYPNPFNPSTIIKYSLPQGSHVTIEVYSLLGQKIATLLDKNISAGNHEISFDGKNLNSGIYIYRLTAFSHEAIKLFNKSQKMILVK